MLCSLTLFLHLQILSTSLFPSSWVFFKTEVFPHNFFPQFAMNMESNNNNKRRSSFSELFGSKESPPPSAGGFASIFPPPATAPRRNSMSGDFTAPRHKQSSGVWSAKYGTSEDVPKDIENVSNSAVNKEQRFFQESVEPSPLSSSLYYGGQEDMYIKSSADRTSQSYSKAQTYSKFKKDGGQDDPDGSHSQSASRGNWWQGSLYY